MTTLRQAAEQALAALKLIDNAMPFPVAKLTIKHLQEVLEEESEQSEWVGLTDEETITQANKELFPGAFARGAIWAQLKLKEKNT